LSHRFQGGWETANVLVAKGRKLLAVAFARSRHLLQELTEAPSQSELCVYRRDKAILALVRLRERFGWGDWRCFLLIGLILGGVQALAALGSGDFLSHRLWSDGFLRDINVFPPFGLVSAIYKAITDRPLGNETQGWYTPVPFLRDYSNLGILLLSALHLTLITRQWPRISSIFRHFLDTGSIVLPRRSFEDLVHKYDRAFNSWVGHILSAGGAFVLLFFVLRSFAAHGFYQGLAPSRASIIWQTQAYQQWWANPSNFLSFGAIFLSYWLVLYILFRHVFIGIIGTFALNEITNKGRVQLVVNHPDGSGGFWMLREAINDVFFSVFLSAGFIFLGFLFLPSEGKTGVFAACITLFLIVNPIFIAFPIAVMHRELKKSRQELLEGLHNQLDHLSGGGLTKGKVTNIDSAAFDSVLAIYHDAQNLPTYPFSARAVLVFVGGYLAPLLFYLAAFVEYTK